MTDDQQEYDALPQEDSWIPYLRTRLPYSFAKIVENNKRWCCLSAPFIERYWSQHHNFWRRGHIYYVVGKLIDYANLDNIWKEYRRLEATRLWYTKLYGTSYSPGIRAYDFYNSMQLDKMWRYTQYDPINRERIVMTNMLLAIEMCLKAIQTHATYRESATFGFTKTHNLIELYNALPSAVKNEIEHESTVFVRQYREFRKLVEQDVREVYQDTKSHALPNNLKWAQIADRIKKSNYTAILGANDPVMLSDNLTTTPPQAKGSWLQMAMDTIGNVTYHRYSPEKDIDEYPTDKIALGLTVARFFYEHLFPVPMDEDWWFPMAGGLVQSGSQEENDIAQMLERS